MNIKTFPSKHMYLYLSLAERKVAEFYHNMVKMTYFHCFLQTIDGVLTDMGRLWSDLGLRKILPGTLWRNWGGRILEIESTPFVHSGVGSPIGCSTPWSSQTATRWCAMRCRYLTNEMVSFICISSSFVYHQANIRTFFMTDYKESKLSTSTSLFFLSFPYLCLEIHFIKIN